jgi:hypothetical protein
MLTVVVCMYAQGQLGLLTICRRRSAVQIGSVM